MKEDLDLKKYNSAFALAYKAGVNVELQCQELGDLIREINCLRLQRDHAQEMLEPYKTENGNLLDRLKKSEIELYNALAEIERLRNAGNELIKIIRDHSTPTIRSHGKTIMEMEAIINHWPELSKREGEI